MLVVTQLVRPDFNFNRPKDAKYPALARGISRTQHRNSERDIRPPACGDPAAAIVPRPVKRNTGIRFGVHHPHLRQVLANQGHQLFVGQSGEGIPDN